jgi:hypothetical protein
MMPATAIKALEPRVLLSADAAGLAASDCYTLQQPPAELLPDQEDRLIYGCKPATGGGNYSGQNLVAGEKTRQFDLGNRAGSGSHTYLTTPGKAMMSPNPQIRASRTSGRQR